MAPWNKSPSWKANRSSVSQKTPRVLLTRIFDTISTLVPVLSRINPRQAFPGPYHNDMVRPDVTYGRDSLQIWSVAANVLNKHSKTTDKGWSPSLEVGWGANSSSSLNITMLRHDAQGLGLWQILCVTTLLFRINSQMVCSRPVIWIPAWYAGGPGLESLPLEWLSWRRCYAVSFSPSTFQALAGMVPCPFLAASFQILR
jgi:hypothetical protein